MTPTTTLRIHVSARIGSLTLDVDIDADQGTLVLIGPNGAGKTSLILALLGIVPADRAYIEVDKTILDDTMRNHHLPVEERRLGYVPQDYALFPHLTVRENVAFAVRSSSRRRDVKKESEQVDQVLRDLGIVPLAERNPQTLSGGEKQRVALARALSINPRALLLDEPLAALDIHARDEVRHFLAETLRSLSLPTIVVTHDPLDARMLGQRIVVIESGKVTQTGTWDDLVEKPASRFVELFTAY